MTKPKNMSDTPKKNEQPPLGAAQLILLIGAIIAGILFAQLAAPTIFQVTPTDLSRSKHLLDVLSSPEHKPEYVVLGNSITMQGIDTRIISEELPGDPLGYNLATTGQDVAQSSMFFSAVPDSVETVIHVYFLNQLISRFVIHPQKYNAMYMYGSPINEQLQGELLEIYGDTQSKVIRQSHLEQLFASRWALRQSLDTQMRNILRSDLDIDDAVTNLYFPSPKAEPLSEKKLVKNLKDTHAQISVDKPFPITDEAKNHLDNFINQVKSTGRRYILVIAPANPRVADYNPPDKMEESLRALKEIAKKNDVPLVDATQLLGVEDFADALHPTPEGAAIFSEYVGQQVADILKPQDGEQ